MSKKPKDMPEAMEMLSKTIAQALRTYGIEMNPSETLQMVREETLNGFRQFIRNDTERSLLEQGDKNG